MSADQPDRSQTTHPKPHPVAIPGNKSGAFDMRAGDRFFDLINGRRGWADEFLSNGDALVTFDDGSYGELRWNHMEKSA